MRKNGFDVSERLAPLFETPGTTYEGFLNRRDRTRRHQRIAAGIVAVAVFLGPVTWFVATGGSDRTDTSATTGPTVPQPSDTRISYPIHVGSMNEILEG